MGPDLVLEIGMEALKTVLLVSMPLLGLGLAVGLAVSIFQAITQIQEMTLTFVPKILAMGAGLFFFSHYMLDRLLGFTLNLFHMIPMVIR